MSTLTIHTAPAHSHWWSALARFLSNIAAGIREGHEIANRYDVLSHLSDADLARHGLDRDNLPQAAVRGVKGF